MRKTPTKKTKYTKEVQTFVFFVLEYYGNLNAFCEFTGLSEGSLYPIFRGERVPKRPLAYRISMATKGKVRMEDFGY